MSSPLDTVLSAVGDYTGRGPRYRAKCPVHDGKSQDSLSITEVEDGTVLMRCWGGCETRDVLRAIGLEWKDLFPDHHPGRQGQRPTKGWNRRQKDRVTLDGEKISLEFVSLAILKLLYPIDDKPIPDDLGSIAFVPFNGLLEDLVDLYQAHQSHEEVQAAWLRMRPDLEWSATHLLAAVDRCTQEYFKRFSAAAGNHAPLVRGKKAKDLLAETFEPSQEIVDRLLFEGLNILVGKPKVGKSRLLLAIAVAIATGGRVLGSIPVEAGDVLNISLEDHERRLQKRIREMLHGDPCPDSLEYEREWRRLDEGGLEDLELWIAQHPNAKLIVIHTFKRVRSRKRRNGSAYDEDYEALQGLQDLANRHPGLAIIPNHHENKMGAVDDWMDRSSGSTGLTGSVDGIMSLRRQRGSADAILTIAHRDIENQEGQYEYALKGDEETGGWSLMGDAEPYKMSQQQQAIYRVLSEATPTAMGPKAIAMALGKTDEKSMATLYVQLNRMVHDNKIVAVEHGKYTVPANESPPPPNVSPPHTYIVKDGKDGKDGKDAVEPAAPTLTTLTSPLQFVKDAEPATSAGFPDNLNNLNNLNEESDVQEFDLDDLDDLLGVDRDAQGMRDPVALPRRELIARNHRLWSH